MEAIIRKAVSDIVVKQLVTSVEREINDVSTCLASERVRRPENNPHADRGPTNGARDRTSTFSFD
jgi:hypothetical protein